MESNTRARMLGNILGAVVFGAAMGIVTGVELARHIAAMPGGPFPPPDDDDRTEAGPFNQS